MPPLCHHYAFEYPAFNYSSKLISLIIVRKEFQLHAPELHTPVSSISPYHAGRTSKVPIRYAIEIKKVKRPRINFTMQLYARHTMTCHWTPLSYSWKQTAVQLQFECANKHETMYLNCFWNSGYMFRYYWAHCRYRAYLPNRTPSFHYHQDWSNSHLVQVQSRGLLSRLFAQSPGRVEKVQYRQQQASY